MSRFAIFCRRSVPLVLLPLLAAGAGAAPTIDDCRIGELDAHTAFRRDTLAQALPGYVLTLSADGSEGETHPTYDAHRTPRAWIRLYPGVAGSLGAVLVRDPALRCRGDACAIGRRYRSVYPGGNSGCRPGSEEYAGQVFCPAPGFRQVTLIFSGPGNGPDDRLPPAARLAGWKVAAILWRAAECRRLTYNQIEKSLFRRAR